MKIPTLLGMAMIITLVALGGLYYYYRPEQTNPTYLNEADVKVVNVTGKSATIVWQTTSPSIGEVIYSEAEPLSLKVADTRDRGLARPRMIHFATINNLKPGTKYFYKIKNDEALFPEKGLEFVTAGIEETEEEEFTYSFIKPLKGTILNTNLNPIDESLIFLDIPGASSLATYSSTAGNFIVPLKNVVNSELDKRFVISENTPAKLTIIKASLRSEVKIKISEGTINLPPITIGSNLDLSNFKPQPFNKITFSTIPTIGSDFNGDQKVNSLDLALLKEAAGTANSGSVNTQSNFDINRDGIVDLEDVSEFSDTLSRNSN